MNESVARLSSMVWREEFPTLEMLEGQRRAAIVNDLVPSLQEVVEIVSSTAMRNLRELEKSVLQITKTGS